MPSRVAKQPAPAVPAVSFSSIATDGPRAYPILDAFSRIGIQPVKGYELIRNGELETFLIGRNRYATEEAIRALLQRCIERSMKESAAQRAGKVAAATKASLRSRAGAAQSQPSEPCRSGVSDGLSPDAGISAARVR